MFQSPAAAQKDLAFAHHNVEEHEVTLLGRVLQVFFNTHQHSEEMLLRVTTCFALESVYTAIPFLNDLLPWSFPLAQLWDGIISRWHGQTWRMPAGGLQGILPRQMVPALKTLSIPEIL